MIKELQFRFGEFWRSIESHVFEARMTAILLLVPVQTHASTAVTA
jgi:hypothetical protein